MDIFVLPEENMMGFGYKNQRDWFFGNVFVVEARLKKPFFIVARLYAIDVDVVPVIRLSDGFCYFMCHAVVILMALNNQDNWNVFLFLCFSLNINKYEKETQI